MLLRCRANRRAKTCLKVTGISDASFQQKNYLKVPTILYTFSAKPIRFILVIDHELPAN